MSRPDPDQLDRDALAEHLRDRDEQREPRLRRRELVNPRRWAFQASVIDSVNAAKASEEPKP
jgi:hypothetical protein